MYYPFLHWKKYIFPYTLIQFKTLRFLRYDSFLYPLSHLSLSWKKSKYFKSNSTSLWKESQAIWSRRDMSKKTKATHCSCGSLSRLSWFWSGTFAGFSRKRWSVSTSCDYRGRDRRNGSRTCVPASRDSLYSVWTRYKFWCTCSRLWTHPPTSQQGSRMTLNPEIWKRHYLYYAYRAWPKGKDHWRMGKKKNKSWRTSKTNETKKCASSTSGIAFWSAKRIVSWYRSVLGTLFQTYFSNSKLTIWTWVWCLWWKKNISCRSRRWSRWDL